MKNQEIEAVLDAYLKIFPAEKAEFSRILKQLKDNEKLNDRRNFHGHIAGNGFVLSPDRSKILLIHHKAYDRWQQPGGHWEPDEGDTLQAARRETEEETNVIIGEYIPIDPHNPLIPYDFHTFAVPARPEKDEPAHWHHDFRYVFISATQDITRQASEIISVGWFDLDAPETENIRSTIQKMRDRKII